jgi:hypothetical protein
MTQSLNRSSIPAKLNNMLAISSLLALATGGPTIKLPNGVMMPVMAFGTGGDSPSGATTGVTLALNSG